jgi:hypothetical protein
MLYVCDLISSFLSIADDRRSIGQSWIRDRGLLRVTRRLLQMFGKTKWLVALLQDTREVSVLLGTPMRRKARRELSRLLFMYWYFFGFVRSMHRLRIGRQTW